MRYTVWSHGRLIGETDLGFRRIPGDSRTGWFHPTGEGERLLPLIASPVPAIGDELRRAKGKLEGESPEPSGGHRSTLLADLAEAYQHQEAADLELRREDGSIVPTADIAFRDTDRLREIAEIELEDLEREEEERDSEIGRLTATEEDRQLERDVMHDLELLEQGFEEGDSGSPTEWTPDDLAEAPLPRYQIQVRLLHGSAVP